VVRESENVIEPERTGGEEGGERAEEILEGRIYGVG
jgi:hypothetical protein